MNFDLSIQNKLPQLLDKHIASTHFAEILFQRHRDHGIVIQKDSQRQIKYDAFGCTLKAYGNGCWETATLVKPNLNVSSLEKTLKKLDGRLKEKKRTGFNSNYDLDSVVKPVQKKITTQTKDFVFSEIRKVLMESTKEVLVANDFYIEYRERTDEYLLINNKRARIEVKMPQVIVACELQFRIDQRIKTVEDMIGYRGDAQLPEKLDLEPFIHRLVSYRKIKKKRIDIPTPLPIIFEPSAAGVFIHEVIGHALEGDYIIGGSSYFRESLNNRICSYPITIIDDPSTAGALGFYPFDHEAIESQRKAIVEKGILKGYLLDLETASLLNMSPTGNARSSGPGQVLLPRCSVLMVRGGEIHKDETYDIFPVSLLVEGVSSAIVAPFSSSFILKASAIHLVRNGKIVQSSGDVLMSGDAEEFLRNTYGLAKQTCIKSLVCAKSGNDLESSVICPSIFFDKVRVNLM
jgi:TldD protein